MQIFRVIPLPDKVFFVLRVISEMFVHVFVILVAIFIATKAAIALFECVDLQRVKTFY